MRLNAVIRILPIVYDSLPNQEYYLRFCRAVTDLLNKNPLFEFYDIVAIFDENLASYSRYLVKDIIPPKNLRYNSMDGWLKVADGIRPRLDRLRTNKPVEQGSTINYPGIDKGDIIQSIIPLSIRTTPEIWKQESHFGAGSTYDGGPSKTISLPYHVTLENDKGEVETQFLKEFDEKEIAKMIADQIALEHMDISDTQMHGIKIKYGYKTRQPITPNPLFERLRVLFYGNDICSDNTLKQTILLFDDLHFHDTPYYNIGAWGHIASPSRIRPYLNTFFENDVPVLVHQGFDNAWETNLKDAVANELEDKRFSKIFFNGFKTDEKFRSLFIQASAKYTNGLGIEIINAMLKLDFGNKSYDLNNYQAFHARAHDPSNEKSLEEVLVHCLIDASMYLNLCCILSHENDLLPFTEYPTLEKLMALRRQRALEKNELLSPKLDTNLTSLARKVFEFVIPAPLLKHITFGDAISFRKETRKAYENFRKYLMKLNLKIEGQQWGDELEHEIDMMLKSELNPALDQFTNECVRIREKMFGGIAKDIISKGLPASFASFKLSQFLGISWIDLLIAGCGIAIPVTKNVIDYALEKRNLKRVNSLTYLIELRKTIAVN